MTRVRISTNVGLELLRRAREAVPGNDDSVVEAALVALIEKHSRAEVDAAYASAYGEHPLDERDEWGDLASFGHAARSR